MKRFEGTQHLTGLRAYAALYVFLLHAGGLGLRSLGDFGNRVTDGGKYGVVVFFVLSALTLTMSIRRRAFFGFRRYVWRRFLRIAPLYYLVCCICLLYPAENYLNQFDVEADGTNLLWHVSFLNLFNLPYLNSLVGVEWTIPIEMWFYLLIPGAVFLAGSKRGVLSLLGLAGLLYLTRAPYVEWLSDGESNRQMAEDYSPQRYIVCFLSGILVYGLRTDAHPRMQVLQRPAAILIVVAIWILHLVFKLGSEVPVYTALTVLLLLVSGPQNRLSQLVFCNRAAVYIGTISYSLYLVHLPIVTLLREELGDALWVGWLALATSLVVASATYALIERPFIRLGQRRK